MAKRTSKISANVEYSAIHKDRTSKVAANLEYAPFHKDRTSKIAVMVEYAIPSAITGRVFGPAVQ